MQQIRQPAVAGSFYPAQSETLFTEITDLLAQAKKDNTAKKQENEGSVPKALIVPHAGYIYSGLTAAFAYAQLESLQHHIKRVVLLGPVHHVPIAGLALPGTNTFFTPLGEIDVDHSANTILSALPQVTVNPAAHAREHSLEVQLPFLQTVLSEFTLLPLAVGDATPEEVAEVLDVVWGGAETLLVISSDLSHYLPYQSAQAIDTQTSQSIIQRQATLNHKQACGGTPINGLLLAAQKHQLYPRLLDLRNSGDTAGDKNHVVGYAAFAFYEAT